MGIGDLRLKYENLEDRIFDLILKFIYPHATLSGPSGSFSLDVQCFAILCHAAFEEHLEDICISVSEEVIEKFDNSDRVSLSTICLLCFLVQHPSLENDSWKDTDRIRERFRTKIHEAVIKYKTEIEGNNGISMKYLKKMLIPIGLDLPVSLKERASLDTLASYRGGFAHLYSSKIKTIPDPKNISEIVFDVLGLMKTLTDNAIRLPYYKI